MSPVEFIELVILCLLEVSFCLNLARQHWNSSSSFIRTHTGCFHWLEKYLKVTFFLFNPSLISSIPALWLKECSQNATSALLFLDSWNNSKLAAICCKRTAYVYQYRKFSTSCSWKQGFNHPEDIGELWHWTNWCGHVWFTRISG